MTSHPTPELSEELAKRIRLVRRDVGDLLFHFTRNIEPNRVTVSFSETCSMGMGGSAYGVLRKILYEERLIGTSRWTYGKDTICFTEAPIQEFNSVFSLVSIASTKAERPRYEPYGIAVSKKWLYEQGGRPVIYDHPDAFPQYPESLRYRFVPYDPTNGTDFTWEREWRIQAAELKLDPKHTLVVVPTSEEAFEIVYEFANIEADWDDEGSISGSYHAPKWLAVSLDMFGFKCVLDNA
ncbi:MAG: hypothetical protein J0M13_14650 [Candidatus Accumulibacter sp.]|nr:hypothetical protein [Candidatus Accumulibacter necessarius]